MKKINLLIIHHKQIFFIFTFLIVMISPESVMGTNISNTFSIAVNSFNEESAAAVAFDGTNYLVGFRFGTAGSKQQIGAQLVSQMGQTVGSRLETGRTGGAPRGLAFDGRNYLIVWEDDANSPNDELYGRFIDISGSFVGSAFQISGPNIQEVGGTTYGGGSYLVVYFKEVDFQTGDSKVYCRIVSTSGSVSNEIEISSGFGDFSYPNVAYDGNNFFVVWTDDSNDSEVKGRFVGTDGTLGTEITINSSSFPSDNNLTVGFDGTNYLVVWNDEVGGQGSREWDIFAQFVTPSGTLSGGVITVTNSSGTQIFPGVAFDGTNYLVTWVDASNDVDNDWNCDPGEGTCWDMYGQFISTSGSLVGSSFAVNTDSGNQLGGALYGGGKYLVVMMNFSNYISGEEASITDGDITGLFVTTNVNIPTLTQFGMLFLLLSIALVALFHLGLKNTKYLNANKNITKRFTCPKTSFSFF